MCPRRVDLQVMLLEALLDQNVFLTTALPGESICVCVQSEVVAEQFLTSLTEYIQIVVPQ